jgi:SAM-dependent methyltransferase
MGASHEKCLGPTSLEREIRYRWAAEATAGGRVLDAACGRGWGTAVLAVTATAAVGVDFAPGPILDAQRDHGEVADFHEGDLRNLPFNEEEFDGVVCFEALAHVAEPSAVLDELCRVLRSGGRLLVSAPNPSTYPQGNPLHLSEITPNALSEMLSERFANVAVYGQWSCFASLLIPQEGSTSDGFSAEIKPRTMRLGNTTPGSELHAVAVASDGELPPPPSWLAVGENPAYESQQMVLEEWQERAIEAEAEVLALKRELREPQR